MSDTTSTAWKGLSYALMAAALVLISAYLVDNGLAGAEAFGLSPVSYGSSLAMSLGTAALGFLWRMTARTTPPTTVMVTADAADNVVVSNSENV